MELRIWAPTCSIMAYFCVCSSSMTRFASTVTGLRCCLTYSARNLVMSRLLCRCSLTGPLRSFHLKQLCYVDHTSSHIQERPLISISDNLFRKLALKSTVISTAAPTILDLNLTQISEKAARDFGYSFSAWNYQNFSGSE